MKEVLNELIQNISDVKFYAILPVIFIFMDILTGWIKALKNKKANSSVGRDGFCKKLGWLSAIALGYVFYFFLNTNIVLIGTAVSCILTELTSILENLSELGVDIPFSDFFEKIKKKGE